LDFFDDFETNVVIDLLVFFTFADFLGRGTERGIVIVRGKGVVLFELVEEFFLFDTIAGIGGSKFGFNVHDV